MQCDGHEPDYEHFDGDLGGLEAIFDIGLKRIVMQVFTDPMPPPYVVASFTFKGPNGQRRYLPFAMGNHGWTNPDRAEQEDFDHLVEAALPRLAALLASLEDGSYEEPEHPIWI